MLKLTDQTTVFTAYCLGNLSFKNFCLFSHALLTPYMQGLVLGVFEEEGNVQLSEAAARFDQTLSGKLSELLKMQVTVISMYVVKLPSLWHWLKNG